MKPLKKKISVTLDGDMVEKLKILVEDSDRSLSQYINLVLKEHVNLNLVLKQRLRFLSEKQE